MTASRLADRARADRERYGRARLAPGTVTAVTQIGPGRFQVELEDAVEPLLTRRTVLVTGVQGVFPQVAGFFEHYGADVLHCPTCGGFNACGGPGDATPGRQLVNVAVGEGTIAGVACALSLPGPAPRQPE